MSSKAPGANSLQTCCELGRRGLEQYTLQTSGLCCPKLAEGGCHPCAMLAQHMAALPMEV